jgi:hypothetical protein
MKSLSMLEVIIDRLGGLELLAEIGAENFGADENRVSFILSRYNPKGVRSVMITAAGGRAIRDGAPWPLAAALVPGAAYRLGA